MTSASLNDTLLDYRRDSEKLFESKICMFIEEAVRDSGEMYDDPLPGFNNPDHDNVSP